MAPCLFLIFVKLLNVSAGRRYFCFLVPQLPSMRNRLCIPETRSNSLNNYLLPELNVSSNFLPSGSMLCTSHVLPRLSGLIGMAVVGTAVQLGPLPAAPASTCCPRSPLSFGLLFKFPSTQSLFLTAPDSLNQGLAFFAIYPVLTV